MYGVRRVKDESEEKQKPLSSDNHHLHPPTQAYPASSSAVSKRGAVHTSVFRPSEGPENITPSTAPPTEGEPPPARTHAQCR